MTDITVDEVAANGIEITVATAGTGPAILLLHGFPHTWRIWEKVIPTLAASHRVIAPDLRGLGGTTRAKTGYDAGTLAQDAEALLDALGERTATVVGIDAGAPPAFLLAMHHPERVDRLVLMESLLGDLPGAEAFTPPWWFGFHQVPDLAEQVLTGHEAKYLRFFLTAGTQGRGVPPDIETAFTTAYTGHDSLRCAFEHYRAMPTSTRQIRDAVAHSRLTTPTLTIGAHPVGSTLERQLRPIADNLTGRVIPDCGHIIPLDRPAALLQLLLE
ncbi:alpha/beta fold hydrolase [Umezawaea endophytica]|uniref:Alpha/beta hydrolase n=1 Tax=Umezawaea endophytica TaxID=1654476 RepID=A0A9X2VTD3_9PSEU|nr:alpha/beta hydrolase [Umezawaea endophytica]MCS7481779.1 alpha/beta hydrolase [Umezawaea endophytica]